MGVCIDSAAGAPSQVGEYHGTGRPVVLSGRDHRVDLTPHIETIVDPDHGESADSVRVLFASGAGRRADVAPNLGITNAVVWVRFVVLNPLAEEGWVLHVDVPRIWSVRLVAPGMPPMLSGAGVSLERRPFRDSEIIFPMPSEKTLDVLLRIETHTSSLPVALTLQKLEAYRTWKADREHVTLLYTGLAVGLIAYNFLLGGLLRRRVFLAYAAYAALFTLLLLDIRGFAMQHLWNGAGVWGEVSAYVLAMASLASLTWFVRIYARPPGHHSVWENGLWALIVLHLVLAVALTGSIAFPDRTVRLGLLSATGPVIFISVAFLLTFVIQHAYHGSRASVMLLLAFAPIGASAGLTALYLIGIISFMAPVRESIVVASAAEMILLAIGVADQFRQSDRERYRARSEAEAKNRLLQTVSHEIRTPLTSIVGLANLLERSPLGEGEKQYVASLGASSRHLSVLLEDLLTAASLDSGELPLKDIGFQPETTIAEALACTRADIETRGLKLETGIRDMAGVSVRGDPDRFRQVLINLLTNAAKYTEHGYVRLEAESRLADGRVQISVTVRDSGPGIAPDQLERIFTPFLRLSARGPGLGLGLSISRRIVDSMGGTLRAESKLGEGSRFLLRLALTPADRTSSNPESPGHARLPLSILVAEDDAAIGSLMRATLSDHQIDVCASGVEAVRMFESGNYDVVFMDWELPILNGLAAVRAMRSFEQKAAEAGRPKKRSRIIALTANGGDQDERISIAAGCDVHLSKPLGIERLREAAAGR